MRSPHAAPLCAFGFTLTCCLMRFFALRPLAAAALLLLPTLAACDSDSDDSFNASAYVGTYTGTATAQATGQSATTVPAVITIATPSSSTITIAVGLNGDTPTTVSGTYNDDGASFSSSGYNIKVAPSGGLSGSVDLGDYTATVSGSITRSRFSMLLTTTAGTLRYEATK